MMKSTYNFYTYDASGKDTIIPIVAESEDAAWDELDFIYNVDTLIIDQVIKGDAK